MWKRHKRPASNKRPLAQFKNLKGPQCPGRLIEWSFKWSFLKLKNDLRRKLWKNKANWLFVYADDTQIFFADSMQEWVKEEM